jgi:hypothetical protein
MDPISLTLAGLVIAALTFVPTTLSWWEARQQRKLAEGARASGSPGPNLGSTPSNRTEWRCGIYDYPPLSSWSGDAGESPSGPLVILAQTVAKTLGKSITFELFNFDDFYTEPNAIPDLIVGMFETPRRRTRVAFSRSIHEIGLQGICRIEQQGDLLLELREGRLKVAVHSAEVGWEFVQDELQDAIKDHRVATIIGGHQLHTMSLLTAGTYDVVLMDHLSCIRFLRQADHETRFRLAFRFPLQKYRSCMALRTEHAHLLPALNEAIVASRNSPDFLRLESEAIAGVEDVVERRALRARSLLTEQTTTHASISPGTEGEPR